MDHCVLRSFRVLLCFLGVVQMAVYKMIVTYLVLLRSLRLAALHALRAAGVEFTSARRIQCRGDIALQNDPVFLCFRKEVPGYTGEAGSGTDCTCLPPQQNFPDT